MVLCGSIPLPLLFRQAAEAALGEREKDVPPAASEARGEVVRASSSKGLGWPGWPKKKS